jgi:hypothetical protein
MHILTYSMFAVAERVAIVVTLDPPAIYICHEVTCVGQRLASDAPSIVYR